MAKRPDRDVLRRLGPSGLERVLDDVLDHGRLVRLANTCGLRYPGMRTQSQKREKVISDLAGKAAREEASLRAVLKILRKETARLAREWKGLGEDERTARIASLGESVENGSGALLFVLADAEGDAGSESLLERLAGNGEGRPPAPDSAGPDLRALVRENSRLRKRATESQKKLQHLEGQVARGKETEKALKRDLIQRKGELAESRMLAERLRRELDEARDSARAAKAGPPPEAPAGNVEPRIEELARAVRKLAAEQRKLSHHLGKKSATEPPQAVIPAGSLEPVLEPLRESLEEMHKEITALRRERRRDLQDHRKRLHNLHVELGAVREAAESSVPRSRAKGRRKGETQRVGVFVDVQNMYYSARQLKGKLDFDALLQAAVLDRRLIQATAYVVETKEIDQSGFIAMLQQRGIEVRRKNLKVRTDGSMKGDWDMEMALDILDAAPRLDVVALVSGDGDFTSLVGRVKAIGPRVEVLGFPRNTAKSLLEAADRFQPLDRKFMIRGEASSKGSRAAARPAAREPEPPATPEGPSGS